MSAAVSGAVKARPKAVTLNVRERTRDVLSAINLHWAGVGLLGLVNLYLLINMGFAWQQVRSHDADALARQQVALKTADLAARPLQGLDVKLAAATTNADGFYRERLPVNYSEVATELGVLAKRQGVRLTRAQYAQAPVMAEAAGQLTEVRIDASLSGDYRPLVLFLNGLERDKLFFLINGVTLTGQQTGRVNLRIRLTTYLRGLGSEEEMRRVALDLDPAVQKANAVPSAATAIASPAGVAR